jgi:hypothetical protein
VTHAIGRLLERRLLFYYFEQQHATLAGSDGSVANFARGRDGGSRALEVYAARA